MPLAENDVKSELSYAYLHAVASRAGCICEKTDRLVDHLGIDARLTFQRATTDESLLSFFNVFVQLKATQQQLALAKNPYSFRLEKTLYDRMRVTSLKSQWLLVVLVMPEDAATWLTSTTRALSLQRCAYWVSLRGAPDPKPGSDDRLTIYIPKRNRFTVAALQDLLARCAREDR